MPKLDKSKYTKQQIQTLLAERRRQKALESYTPNLVNDHTNKTYGFVLGNGLSRKGIDPEQLKEFGKVYGCNAIYREMDPDYLVAVDVKMILEITGKNYQKKNKNVWTNLNKAYKNIEGLNYFKPSKGWSSGPTALFLATQHLPSYKKIFILGFDYAGTGDNLKKVNNIYAGSPNYKKQNDGATYYGNWLRQTTTILKTNPQITFYRVILPDNIIPPELNKFSNLKHITIKEFKQMFNLCT